MAHLYPSLQEKFRSEGLCPICLMEMAYAPRFTCTNSHLICNRCRPYYYSCPQCFKPLREIPAACSEELQHPPGQLMPHTPHLPRPYPPSAPEINEFYGSGEMRHPSCGPSSPPRQDQELLECPYAYLGCTAKFVPLLRDMHVSRCQYRHHSQDEPASCSLPNDSEEYPCKYASVGCNVRAPRWRLTTHQEICIYKGRHCNTEPLEQLSQHLEGSCQINSGDPNRMVECCFRGRGCMVRMPLWRKPTHETKCNYRDDYNCDHPRQMYPPVTNPEEQTNCRWAAYGCRVRPRYSHKEIHESKCNFRMEECAYKHRGCDELIHPSQRYAHERSCGYAY